MDQSELNELVFKSFVGGLIVGVIKGIVSLLLWDAVVGGEVFFDSFLFGMFGGGIVFGIIASSGEIKEGIIGGLVFGLVFGTTNGLSFILSNQSLAFLTHNSLFSPICFITSLGLLGFFSGALLALHLIYPNET